MAIKQLLADQSISFDNHTRCQEVTELKKLHFHKRMNANSKKYARAEIIIYVDGNTKWECKGEHAQKLQKELQLIFEKMSVTEKITFVYNIGEEIDRFFRGNPSLEEKKEIRNNIVKAFYGDNNENNAIISSSNFKKVFFSDVSEVSVKIDGKKYRITFFERNGKKSITIKDITNNQ